MNRWSSKNRLPILLAMVALLIWAYNGYKFFKGVQQEEDTGRFVAGSADAVQIEERNIPAGYENWVYKPMFRDPFQNWLVVQKKPPARKRPPKSRPKRPVEPVIPPLRFIGLIQDEGGRMAVLEDTNKEIYFGHTGDTIAGVKILSVDSTRVGGSFKGKPVTFALK